MPSNFGVVRVRLGRSAQDTPPVGNSAGAWLLNNCSRGRPLEKGHFGALGTALDFSVFDTRFPFALLLPQVTTVALLEERALELGGN